MKVGKLTAWALTAFAVLPAAAQTEHDTLQTDSHYFYQELNVLENMYSGTDNPVALSHNRVQSIADAQGYARFLNGRFHDIDEGRKTQAFGASINGLQRFGKLSVAGYFEYLNAKSYDSKWNNTLFVTETNPFLLGDEIASDVNTEIFRMSAAASYRFCPLFTGALRLSYKTGSRSDQTDPRPKTDAMHFVINPGMEFQLGAGHSLGAALTVDLFRSELSHAVVNNNNNYIYYVMKGMGDYLPRTSSDLGSYPREYNGNLYKASLQYLLTPQDSKVSNLLEVSYTHNKEVSEDGGYAFTYKSGDYYRTDISVYDRLKLRHSDRFEQDFSVRFNYATDSGDWYDQKKVTNTEHGNAIDYIVLNKSTIRESKYLHAEAGYQGHLLRNGLPDFSFSLGAAYDKTDIDQYYTRTFGQEYQMLSLNLGAAKHWQLGKVRLSGKLDGFYRMQLGDAVNDCIVKKKNDISQSYVTPAFAYDTADQAGFHAEADLYLPVTLYKYQTWMGFKVRGTSAFYLGDNDYTDLYHSASRTYIDAAFSLIF